MKIWSSVNTMQLLVDCYENSLRTSVIVEPEKYMLPFNF
jgi:hypothetical protein